MKFSVCASLLCLLLLKVELSAQNCTFPLFGQNYSIGQGKITIGAMRLDANNTFIAVGGAEQTSGGNTDPCILKFDNLGKLIWAKRVPIAQNTGFLYNVKTTTDGGYIAVGNINAQPAIIKFSATGIVQWSKISNDGSGDRGNFGDHYRSVIQTKTGEYVASGSIGLNAVTYVTKFSATGTMLWTRQIGTSSNDWSVGLDEFNDGNLIVASNTTSTTNTYLMKLSVVDGSTLWQKQYTSGASNACCDHSFDEITKAADGNFLIVGNWQADVGLFQKVDNNGNIIFAKTIQNTGQAFRSTHSTSTPDGGYTVSQFDYNNQLQRTILKFDANLNVQWVKKIGGGGEPFVKGVLPLTDGSYVMLANENDGFFMKKTDALANTCESMEVGRVTVQSVQSQISDGTFDNTADGSLFDAVLVAIPLSVNVANRCICPVVCTGCFDKDSVKVVGIDTACYNTDFTYKLKNYRCAQFTTTWNVLGNGVTITTKTDTTLTVRFNQGTSARLTVFIQDSCSRDTLMFKTHVIAAPPVLELGADRNICLPTAFTFRAGKGFKTYLWQNGSTDSIFTTSVVGRYWVRVADSCGAVQSDTVRIIQTTPPNFNITPDTLRMCEGDRVEAVALAGFATYRWFPVLGVNNAVSQRVFLTPSVSSKYFCQATTSLGCSTLDSVWVDVKPFYRVVKTATICDGFSYNFGDTVLRKAGVYNVRIKSKTGDCDTLSRLTLTIKSGNACDCHIYIPNTFSPFFSQNINDTFFPFGSDCAKSVAIMQIFDRWGELIFTKSDFPLNNEAAGWNGTFKGKQLPPDVYVYRIDILLTNGLVERFAGDVTIVR